MVAERRPERADARQELVQGHTAVALQVQLVTGPPHGAGPLLGARPEAALCSPPTGHDTCNVRRRRGQRHCSSRGLEDGHKLCRFELLVVVGIQPFEGPLRVCPRERRNENACGIHKLIQAGKAIVVLVHPVKHFRRRCVCVLHALNELAEGDGVVAIMAPRVPLRRSSGGGGGRLGGCRWGRCARCCCPQRRRQFGGLEKVPKSQHTHKFVHVQLAILVCIESRKGVLHLTFLQRRLERLCARGKFLDANLAIPVSIEGIEGIFG
mmetsp:Transcript_31028/g.85500  ORF Transcript_31028/g.85500 Transcript_31028/m.85500 type:complete len:266 (-) Transcript_31028:1265-2062(-)